MPEKEAEDFTRYLAAKKSVDDRALNRAVWEALRSALPEAGLDAPLHVLEVGAGIGTMVERVVDWDLLHHARYTAVDSGPLNLQMAARRLPSWAASRGYQVGMATPGEVEIHDSTCRLQVRLQAGDAFEFLVQSPENGRWDLLLAHAFLDLVDLPTALPVLLAGLRPGGLFYFTLNFDGLTAFEPQVDPSLDAHLIRLYHESMDTRPVEGFNGGHSHTGRRLFAALRTAHARILAAGSSDWVVFPREGGYPDDEAYFLGFILQTVRGAVRGHQDLAASEVEAWTAQRLAQIERGELVYIAHQIDVLGQIP